MPAQIITNPPMSDYQFGACEVRLASREVLLDGVAQPVEPRVFALLALLISQRHRVVPRQELMQTLWADRPASGNSLSRAISQARRAIGDTARNAAWIKTVDRVGYRFVAPLHREPPSPPPQPWLHQPLPTLQPRARAALCVLPFVAPVQQPSLQWTSMGLMMLATQALQADARLNVTAPLFVLEALQQASEVPLPQDRVSLLCRLLCLDFVVQGQLVQEGAGWSLQFECLAANGSGWSDQLQGTELMALGQRMSAAIHARIFPQDDAPLPVAVEKADPFIYEAYARALQAILEGRWDESSRLLDIVLNLAPDNRSALLTQVQVLVIRGRPEARLLGERLLQCAQAVHNARATGVAHHLLAQACLQSGMEDAVVKARQHARQALELAQAHPDAEWSADICQTASMVHLLGRDIPAALRLLDQVQQQAQRAGNLVRCARVMAQRGSLLSLAGERQHARVWLVQALALAQQQGLRDDAIMCQALLAQISLWAGSVQDARRYSQAVWQELAGVRDRRVALFCVAWNAAVDAELRSPRTLQDLVLQQGGRDRELSPWMQALQGLAQVRLAIARGDPAAAAALLGPWMQRAWSAGAAMVVHWCAPLQLYLWACAQRWKDGLALCARLRAMPTCQDDHELLGAMAHFEACQAHAQGNIDRALLLLSRANDLMPTGRWRSYARLDAAWLYAERGEVDAARRLLVHLGTWSEEHPLGQLVSGRLAWAAGDTVRARALWASDLAQRWASRSDFLAQVPPATEAGSALLSPARRLPSIW